MKLNTLDAFDSVELNFNEMQLIGGCGDPERKEAACVSAIVGITMLACAATPVGWVLCVGGILGMMY